MKIKLNETKVSLTKGRFFKWLLRGRRRLAAAVPAVLVLALGGVIFRSGVTDSSDYIKSESSGDYVMCWQHYSGFDTSDIHIGVRLNSVSDEIYLQNNTAQLQYSATVYPQYFNEGTAGGERTVSWSSSNDVVASVDENGLVIASTPGEAQIKATVSYDGKEYVSTAYLRVIQPVSGIYMPTTTIDIYNGGSGHMLTAAVSPANSTNQNIVWKSKNEKIASVDQTGFVKPVGTGMTEVCAVTEDGGFLGKCFVNVINYSVKVDSVTIQNDYKDNAFLKEGETLTVAASVLPSNARDRTLKWVSTNPEVASVSQTGIVRALKEGETYINVASGNGKNDMLKLTVQPGDRTDRLNLGESDASDSAGVEAPPGYTGAPDGTVTYEYYDYTLDEVVDIQMGLDPPPKTDGGLAAAPRSMVYQQMDPTAFCEGAYKYQFLDLSHTNGVSADELNKYLADKGILAGHAQDYIDAANECGISELYLVAHSMLETGHGTSALATGITVNGVKVYNMFGIGAYDDSANYSGSRKAYSEGWTTVSAAIKGGGKWISEHYINAPEGRQNTLYKILFNPAHPGQHQYATACRWATIQATNLDKLFSMFPSSVKTYEVPVFKGMTPPVIDTSQ